MKTKLIKTKFGRGCLLVTMATALAMVSGCVVEVGPPSPPPPGPLPAPVVEVPDYYVWDGYEYVGMAGTQYYYLGAGQVWVVCDPVRLERFHSWEGYHPDWRDHATHNVNFRSEGHGDSHPMAQGEVSKEKADTHQNVHPVVQPGVQNQKPNVHGNIQQGGAKKGKPAPKKKDDQKNDDHH